jgi:hypothetical protein
MISICNYGPQMISICQYSFIPLPTQKPVEMGAGVGMGRYKSVYLATRE